MTILMQGPIEVPFGVAVAVFLALLAGGLYVFHHYLQHDDRRNRKD